MQGSPRSVAVLVTLVVLAIPTRAIADVEIMLSNGDVLPAASVERNGDEFVVLLFGGGSVRVAGRLVAAIRFTPGRPAEREHPAPGKESPEEIVLLDGRVLTAVSVDRRDGLYILDLGGGELVTLPAALVSETRPAHGQGVASTGAELETPEKQTPPPPVADATATRSVTEPRPIDYAGSTALPPSMTQQLGVFRGPAVTRRSETWQPADSYGWANDVTHFDSSRWNDSFDSRFRPSSAYEPSEPGPDFNTSKWYRPGGQSSRWRPQEGWADAIWFPGGPTTP